MILGVEHPYVVPKGHDMNCPPHNWVDLRTRGLTAPFFRRKPSQFPGATRLGGGISARARILFRVFFTAVPLIVKRFGSLNRG